jgi:hypothetical protein
MIQQLELVLLPEEAADQSKQLQQASQLTKLDVGRIKKINLLKRSIDARGRTVKIRLLVEIFIDELPPVKSEKSNFNFKTDVSRAKEVFIVGFGPAGMFAALKLIEAGIKPVIIERGKDVKRRRRDLAMITRQGQVDGDSNYCFGEGGAGTYSDGKLYTRSNKRGDIHRILNIFVEHGADPDIRIDAHPHIGTNKLPHIVEAIRKTISDAGGEILFETRLEDILVKDDALRAIQIKNLNSGEITERACSKMILATGHSARDIYELLHRRNIKIEAKPFALGVRVEHPQEIIDKVQYHCDTRGEFLPPASYSLTHQHEGRGVYSFCMCPGGIIAPAATAPNEIVVNGWSPSRRNNPFANSGMVVSILEKDYSKFSASGELASLKYQQEVEQKAYQLGGGRLKAPAQRLIDFVNGKTSGTLPECSYFPGTTSIELREVLPSVVAEALKGAMKEFGKKMKSYYTNDAILVATESRTSSPVRIPRDPETLEHPQVKGLYPCGEGAGYAGGIVSAAMDGERCATSASLS